MLLKDVCSIHTGYTARGRLEAVEDDGVLVIQLRDVASLGGIDPERLVRVQIADPSDRYLVRSGDIVFRSRGENNTATIIDRRLHESALAMLPLLIFRPNTELVLPEYLAWVINQPPAQRYFDGVARGTNMRMIPRSSLDDLRVDIPDLHTQRKIVDVDMLARREQELSSRAANVRRKLVSRVLMERATDTNAETTKRTSK